MTKNSLLSNFKYYGTLAKMFFKMNLKSSASYYGWSFVGVYVAHVLGYIASYITIWGAMRSFDSLLGWSLAAVMFIYSIDLFSYSLAQMFVQVFWRMDDLVGKGELDNYLLRPVDSFVHLFLHHIEFGYLAHITVALAALIFAIVASPVAWTGTLVVALIITLIAATLLQIVFGSLPACAAFWFINSQNFTGLIRWGTRTFIQYPIIIYPAAIRFFISFIIPIAFVNYYPSLVMLGKAEGIWIWGPVIALVLGVGLMVVTLFTWRFSVRRYSSSG